MMHSETIIIANPPGDFKSFRCTGCFTISCRCLLKLLINVLRMCVN